jgi:transcriptional regulator with XRE-family HTH domain
MLSPLGKEIRKMRLDHEDTPRLKDMAEALGVSSAYLSAIETGRKSASPALVDKICDLFKADDAKRQELRRLAMNSTKYVQLQLTGQSSKSRELATAFARRFPSLDEDTVETLLQVIQQDEAAGLKPVK